MAVVLGLGWVVGPVSPGAERRTSVELVVAVALLSAPASVDTVLRSILAGTPDSHKIHRNSATVSNFDRPRLPLPNARNWVIRMDSHWEACRQR